MPLFNCDVPAGLNKITRPDTCAKKESITQLAWGRIAELDLDTVADEPAGDKSTQVTMLPMIGGATMYPIEIDSETVTFTSTYSNDNGYHEWALTFDQGGFTADQLACFCEAESLCDIFLWMKVGCKEVIVGLINNNGVYQSNYRGEITARTLSFGGGNDSSNSTTIGGKMDCDATCANIGYDNLPLAAC